MNLKLTEKQAVQFEQTLDSILSCGPYGYEQPEFKSMTRIQNRVAVINDALHQNGVKIFLTPNQWQLVKKEFNAYYHIWGYAWLKPIIKALKGA